MQVIQRRIPRLVEDLTCELAPQCREGLVSIEPVHGSRIEAHRNIERRISSGQRSAGPATAPCWPSSQLSQVCMQGLKAAAAAAVCSREQPVVCEEVGGVHVRAAIEAEFGIPPEHLHVTIATLRRYDAANLNPADREVTLNEWRHILDGAKISQGWPPAPFRLRVTGATFRGGCATLDISDEDGAIAAMRSALELSIRARGGHAVTGGVEINR